MAKYLPTSVFRTARTRRGLSQKALAELSGYSDNTLRTAEADPKNVSDASARTILEALASVSPLTTVEVYEIARALGWDFHAVDGLNETARRASRAKPEPAEARIDRSLSQLAEHAEPLGAVLDALARLCSSVADSAQRDLMDHENLPDLLASLTHTHFIELKAEHNPDGELGHYRYTATLPAAITTGTATLPVVYCTESGVPIPLPDAPAQPLAAAPIRIVRTPEVQPDGTTIERFNYYKHDGTRLIPVDELPTHAPQVTVRTPDNAATKKPRTK